MDIPGEGSIVNHEFQWYAPSYTSIPGGGTTETQYTRLLQTSATLSKDPAGNVFASNEYTLDKSGNVTNRISHNDSIGYAYDDLGRLISHVSQSSGTETFTYDEVANIATALENGQPITFTRNANNELLSYGDATFQYDENGAVISRTENNETVNYFYDVDGRMIRVENGSGGVIAEYCYDPFGRRLWKEVNGTRTCYFYSDEGLIGEFTSTGTLIKSYGYKPDSMWSSNPLFMVQDGVYYYYHNDRIGAPQVLVRANGSTAWSATYSAYGKASVDPDSDVENNLRFPGQYYDAETGLHYNLNRYYDPEIGAYRSPDPLGLGGGVNLYAYTAGNPANYVDPLGLLFSSMDNPTGYLVMETILLGDKILSVVETVKTIKEAIDVVKDPCLTDEEKYDYFKGVAGDLIIDALIGKALGKLGDIMGGAGKKGADYVDDVHIHGIDNFDTKKTAIPGPCFTAGTLVSTDQGLTPIEEIEPGDMVLSRDEESGLTEYKQVVQTFITPEQSVLELELEDGDGNVEEIGVTPDHPFRVKGKGWVGAQKLLPGDEVYTSRGGWLRVSGGAWLEGTRTVYNMEVKDFHTYFVGQSAAWVHNMCADDIIKKVYNSIKDAPNYPVGFRAIQNGLSKNIINNKELLENLRKIESGKWYKVYKDGYDAMGNKVTIHYFQSKSGKVFNVKVYYNKWSNER